jgi:kojibiose phosphorylase
MTTNKARKYERMFSRLIPKENWSVCEENIDEGRLRFFETIFTLGNGYLGSRGILEEGYDKAYAGTYVAGIYDKSEGQSYELVNAPNPVSVEVFVNGKKLGKEDVEVVEHRRILDMQKAVLWRRTIFADDDGRCEYESMRFFSLEDMHVGVMSFKIRLPDTDAHVTVKHAIDGSTKNEIQAIENPIRHYTTTHTSTPTNGVSYLEAKTNDLGILIGIATACEMKGAKPNSGVTVRSYREGESIAQEFSFTAKKGKSYQFNGYVSIYTSRELKRSPKIDCLNGVGTAMRRGLSDLLKGHIKAWDSRWRYSDIVIEGDPLVQRAIRLDIYHLLIAAPKDDLDVSIGAKTLSGEWYKGHVFWDTEIYMLPFFIYTQPKVARDFLMYRYRRLKQAKRRAETRGYKGALWPWESAGSGKEETPQTFINFDGKTKIPVYTAEREHHIASDVPYGVLSYYKATGDEDFFLQYGAEMLFEAARFWASRVTYNEKSGCYDIKEVIGPNEFQESVDNNSFTNYMAKWVLRSGSEVYRYLQKKHPHRLGAIAGKMGLQEQEFDIWKELADKIVFLTNPQGLVEEFEGYFNRSDVLINQRDENGMPVWPSAVDLAELKKTQLVKQADVILLLHLFSPDFPLYAKRNNFEYYEKRTMHKSSLSVPSYATIALELGKVELAYRYLTLAVNSDLGDIYRNTDLGVHAAALGGAWQIAVCGFAGIRLKSGVLAVNPTLPSHWHKMRFRLWFRDSLIEFALSKRKAEAIMLKGQTEVDIELYGNRYCLHKGQRFHAQGK